MHPRYLPHILLAAMVSISSLRAEYRPWTNTEGVKIEAEFVKTEGDNVTLRLRNGRTTTFAESKLSADDIAFIKAIPAAAEKPAAPIVVPANRKAKWLEKMELAKKESMETGLPIFVLFTGTSWCGYCVQLENNVFSKKEFTKYANKNLVLLKYEFPGPGKPKSEEGGEAAKKFQVRGFPWFFLLGADEKIIVGDQTGCRENPEAFAKWVESCVKK